MLGAVEGNNSINAVRFFNAQQAFKTNPIKPEEQAPQELEAGLDIKEDTFLKDINTDEIKQYADSVGEHGLSDEDIKYGLKYGRSVLIDYSA